MGSTLKHIAEALESTAAVSGRALVIDAPRPADLIVVLAGGRSCRALHAFQLFRKGLSRRILISARSKWEIFGTCEYELVKKFLSIQPADVRAATEVMPLQGDSSVDEAEETGAYFDAVQANSVLVVTSDFHTRRALSIYRTMYPDLTVNVSAAEDSGAFDVCWWKRRRWAKTMADETMKLIWWTAVDRRRVNHLAHHLHHHGIPTLGSPGHRQS